MKAVHGFLKKCEDKGREFLYNKFGFINIGTVTAIVAGFIVLMIGAVIFWSVYDSMTFPSEANVTGLTNMFTNVWNLLPIVMLVGAAGLIIAVITGFTRR